MSKKVDIWWTDGGRLKASMRWTNKRGRINFFLVPSLMTLCPRCPFDGNPICSKWRSKVDKMAYYDPGLCSRLWNMEGDNKFENREKINGWQPLGPVERGRKKNRKLN